MDLAPFNLYQASDRSSRDRGERIDPIREIEAARDLVWSSPLCTRHILSSSAADGVIIKI